MTPKRLQLPFTLLLAACFVTSSLQAHQPPRDLKLVGDHWTAWDPPTSFPEGSEIHIIQRGDTLWDLAAAFYGDAYLWPQLWEQNPYVLDAHWIYPGDPLVVSIQVDAVDDLDSLTGDGAGDEVADDGDEGLNILSADEALGDPVLLGSQSDIYCSGYVGGLRETFPFQVIGSEFENLVPELTTGWTTSIRGSFGTTDTVKYGLATGDIVYVDGGRAAGLSPGELFTAIAPGDVVRHPVSNEVYGRAYRYTGRIRVLSVQDTTAIAEIVESCDATIVGSSLRPFEPEPVPLGRLGSQRPVNYPSPAEKLVDAPVILSAADDIVTLGQDHVVFVDRGEDGGIEPGEIYTIYRLNREGLPPVILGELAILSVHERSAVGKIVRSRYAVYRGDRLELK